MSRSVLREEKQRIKRILHHLDKTLHALRVKHCTYGIRSNRMVDLRRKHQALKDKAATKLRITQVEKAIDFYQQRFEASKKLTRKSRSALEPVPSHIMRTVSSLNSFSKQSLKDDLEHALALWSDQCGPLLVEALPSLRRLQHSGIERSQPLLKSDAIISLQSLLSEDTVAVCGKNVFNGDTINKKTSTRFIVVVYQGGWSPLCVATLRAWQSHYKSHIESSRPEEPPLELIGVGMESLASCKDTARKSNLKFPLIPDPTGSLLLDSWGLLVEDHPLQAAARQSSTSLPMVATLVLVPCGSNLYRVHYTHVSVDPTQQCEPLDTLQVAWNLSTSEASPSGHSVSRAAKHVITNSMDSSSIGTSTTASTSTNPSFDDSYGGDSESGSAAGGPMCTSAAKSTTFGSRFSLRRMRK